MVKPVRQRPPRKPLTTTQAWTKVETTAYRLGAAEYLGNKDSNRISKAFLLLNHPPQSTSHRKYRLFLLRKEICGPQGLRLCAVALGHDHIRDTSNGHRDALLDKLGEMRHQPLIKNSSFRSDDTQEDGPLNEQMNQAKQIAPGDDYGCSPCSNSNGTTTPRSLLINNAEADRSIASVGELRNCKVHSTVPYCHADQYFTPVSNIPQNEGQDDILSSN
ncbi:hypothetical protein Pdw03_8064 [Penicillium digitatum]|uniref:Uncharacterized protein n=1 Tax=Penicillium digitatum TaxID=36651 RepID=A0A7T6XMV8_PENDI|nr:hypothetical protein Pdw03_8064 [Penicillium digitatum]